MSELGGYTPSGEGLPRGQEEGRGEKCLP